LIHQPSLLILQRSDIMEREQLKEQLGQLHQELQSGSIDDPEVQQLLHQLAEDIDGLLARTEPESDEQDDEANLSPEEQRQSLTDQLLNLTEEFEDSYPRLAEAIGRVASALSRIGI
jgi:ABC-type transporter Mla subunit MlaD